MLSRVSTPLRTSLALYLLRHFSIRVSSLKKGSLAASLLRRDASPKLSKFTRRGGLLLDPHSYSLPQPEGGLCRQAPFGVSLKLPGQEDHGLGQEDSCSHGIVKPSVRSQKNSKETPCSDGAVNFLATDDNKTHSRDGDMPPSVRSQAGRNGGMKLSQIESRKIRQSQAPTNVVVQTQIIREEGHHSDGAVNLLVTDDNNTHCWDGDMQLSVRSQADQRSNDGAKLSQIESRIVCLSQAPTNVVAQSQIIREEGHHRHAPAEFKAARRDGKRSSVQTHRASCYPCLPSSKSMGVSPLRTDPSEGISSLIASELGDDLAKLARGNVLHTEKEKGNEEQSADITSSPSLKISAPSLARQKREKSKQVKVRETESTEFVEVHSVVIKRKGTDNFLLDLNQKIELVGLESAPLTLVQALLKKTAFLSASPEKLAGVLHVLKEFFEASDMVCDVLRENTGIIAQPLEQLTLKLQVLAEFQVDIETCHKIGSSPYMMILKVEKYQSVLAFLKDMGLSVESRNRMLRRSPLILRLSQNSMQSTVDFFASIGITGPKLLKLLELRPRILSASVNNNLMVKHKLFQQLGFSAKEFIVALERISQNSNEQILLQYNLFREHGISHEDVTKMIRRQPRVLGQSVESLKAKLDFLLHTLNRDISDAVKFPAYFTYSLKDRIIPRLKVLEELNLSRSPCLSTILSRKSSVFRDRFKIPDSMKVI